ESKGSESRGLKAEPRPEHGRVAKRFEPESIDVIGYRRAAAQNHNTQGREQCETNTSAAALPPADNDVTTVFLVAHVPIPPQVRSAQRFDRYGDFVSRLATPRASTGILR